MSHQIITKLVGEMLKTCVTWSLVELRCVDESTATNNRTRWWGEKKSMKRKSGERERERSERKRLMFNHSTLHCFLITKSILRYSSPAALCVMLFMDSCLLACPHPRELYAGIGIQETAVKGVKYRQRALLTWVVFTGGFQLTGEAWDEREDICSPTTCCGHSYCVFCEQISSF